MDIYQLEAVSENIAKEVQFKWTINNFSCLNINDVRYHESPVFQVEIDKECTMWKIELDRTNYFGGKPGCIGARLNLVKGPPKSVSVELMMFDSRNIHLGKLGTKLSPKFLGNEKWIHCPSDYLTKDIIRAISHDDTLILICKLKICAHNHTAKLISRSPLRISKSSIIDDFAKLLMDGEFSDIIISVRGKEFHAHKNIMGARSPVFSSMFKHDMKEVNSGKVEIEDIEPEIFEEFLKFIYTGKGDSEYASELLPAADKYDVQDLKSFCENALIKNLSRDNCFKTLNLSDLYSANNLKNEAINFIVSNNRLADKNGLAQITNLSLSKELIEAFVNQKK